MAPMENSDYYLTMYPGGPPINVRPDVEAACEHASDGSYRRIRATAPNVIEIVLGNGK